MKLWRICIVWSFLLAELANAQSPVYPACVPPMAPPEQQLGAVAVDLGNLKLPLRDYADQLTACGLARGGARLLDTQGQYQDALPVPEPTPVASTWLETDRRLYRELLTTQTVDVLVVPFQTQGYGFDRIERSLMSADLAYALGGKVAAPFLVERVLGEGRRRFSERELGLLAHELNAKTVVVGYAGHLDRKNMLLTVQVWRMPGRNGESQQRRQRDWLAVPFSYESLPSTVFHRMLPDVIEQLDLRGAKKRTIDRTATFPAQLTQTPQQLITHPVKDWAVSSVSLLVAALASSDVEHTRERLFERALLVSMNIDAGHARQRFTQAYALMQLGRRPAALRTLKDDASPAAKVLRELLDGNLPQAASGMADVKGPYERLLLTVAIQDLHHQYRRPEPPDLEDAMRLVAGARNAWKPLIALRLTSSDPWQVPRAPKIKSLLDEIIPRPGLDLQSIMAGNLSLRDGPDDVSVDVITARHLRKATQENDVRTVGLAPNIFDLIWLLEGAAESRLVKNLDRVGHWHALPRNAASLFDKYRPVFDGHPALALQESKNAAILAREADDDERESWRRRIDGGAMLALVYAQGQGALARDASQRADASFESQRLYEAYGHDFPRRSYWSPQLMSNMGIDKAAGEVYALAKEGLAFNQWDPWRAFGDLEMLPAAEREAAAAQLANRFRGVSGLPSFEARRAQLTDPIARYRAAIKEDPKDWVSYKELGRILITEQGDYAEAAKVFLSYPGFDISTRGDEVARSNRSYDAGSQLYWHGEPELAKPLYELAAKLDTGSDASMASAIRLDLLAGNYASAAERSLQRATRYSNAYAYRDYLSLLHAMGYGTEAWTGFSQVATQFDLPQVWVAALVGQRKEGLDAAGLKKWLVQPQIRSARFRARQFALGYALMWNSTDAVPPPDLGRLIDLLEGKPTAKVAEDGWSIRRPFLFGNVDDRHETLAPSKLDGVPLKRLPPGTPVRSSLALFSDGYVSLRAGKPAAAIEKFRTYVERYALDGVGADPYPLAYIAAASAATDDPFKLEKHLETTGRQDFDAWLARAFFHARRHEIDLTENALKQAFQRRPHTDYRPILTEFQFAEACEWIYQITGETRFKTMLLDWTKRHQRIQPTHAWAYAMQYTHESDAEARQRALAMTLYLDPRSPRIAKAQASEIAHARQWLKGNNPFMQKTKDLLQARQTERR